MLNYFAENDVFLRDMGASFTHIEPGKAVVELELKEKHMSLVGRRHAHAGVLYALAESASAAAFLAYGHNGYAVEGSITYMDAAESGRVIATAKCKDAYGDETAKIRVTVETEDGRILARANFISYYIGE